MLIAYSSISILLIVVYVYTILLYVYYWNKLEGWKIPNEWQPNTRLSVLVAARNEEGAIKACLDALVAQRYPVELLEIWIIDDHSEDATANLVQVYQDKYPHVHLLQLTTGIGGKKHAIAAGIEQARGKLVVTTDADCVMSKDWLSYLASYYETHQTKFIAAPVSFYQEQSVFEYFQSLDFMGMMAVAGAGVEGQFMNMCNGANLAYERAAFYEVNGFEGNDHLASGDDMLLMQKIAIAYPNKIAYLKNKAAQTQTHAKSTIKAFVSQRIRWTSKSGAYTGWQVLVMLATVWLLCLTMLLDVLLMPFSSCFAYLFASKFIIKGIMDYYFLGMMANFFERRSIMRYFIPALLMHWWYIAIVGTLGNIVKEYEWKGRKVQ